jgi:hypothetical protein
MSFRGSGTQEGEEEEGGDTARTPQSEGAGLPGEGFARRKQGYEELCSPEFKVILNTLEHKETKL